MKDKAGKNLPVKRGKPYSHAPEVTVMRQTGIKKLANGRYKARYFAGYDSNGKRRYPCKTFDRLGDAAKWRTEKVNERTGVTGSRFTT